MAAAPGGKTTYIAALQRNTAQNAKRAAPPDLMPPPPPRRAPRLQWDEQQMERVIGASPGGGAGPAVPETKGAFEGLVQTTLVPARSAGESASAGQTRPPQPRPPPAALASAPVAARLQRFQTPSAAARDPVFGDLPPPKAAPPAAASAAAAAGWAQPDAAGPGRGAAAAAPTGDAQAGAAAGRGEGGGEDGRKPLQGGGAQHASPQENNRDAAGREREAAGRRASSGA
jgi:hypothetical protein